MLARWMLGTLLLPWLLLFVLMLCGCATKQPEQVIVSAPCPPPPVLPASVSESRLGDAQAFSEKVSNYFQRVRDFLSELRQTKMPSE